MRIQVDLKQNPEVADLIADMQPSDKVKFLTSLRSKNENLAEFTLDKAAECSPEDKKEHYSENEEGDDEGEMMEDEGENTAGGSKQQDRMAAEQAAQ